jgi:hypothetical protein
MEGVISINPSPHGGSWAWCLVEGDTLLRSASGIVLPSDVDKSAVSNNVSECLAAVKAIEAMRPGWDGTLWTDSLITRNRLLDSSSFKGLPQWLRVKALDLRRSKRWKVRLVAGHPTLADLERGTAARNGWPVSKWNKLADQLCQEEAERFLGALR